MIRIEFLAFFAFLNFYNFDVDIVIVSAVKVSMEWNIYS